MFTFSVMGVNQALPMGLDLLEERGVYISPRGTLTLEYPEAVATTYMLPRYRVLFQPLRNKNHFFEFFEALWILAGRSDVAFLTQFNKRMAEYSDNGTIFHAPYGYRLRKAQGFDQIQAVIELLKKDPDTRQAVLQIWDASKDLNRVPTLDTPCNDLLFLKIRNGRLNLSVANRSNDVIWGAYGTNVVQFSMLQEYIAMYLSIPVGRYTQISDSFHVYPDNPLWEKLSKIHIATTLDPYDDPYAKSALLQSVGSATDSPGFVCPTPFILEGELPEDWTHDLIEFFLRWDSSPKDLVNKDWSVFFRTDYFRRTVLPMYWAWTTREVSRLTEMPAYSDWRLGGEIWFANREQK